jgi:hypothetical protein
MNGINGHTPNGIGSPVVIKMKYTINVKKKEKVFLEINKNIKTTVEEKISYSATTVLVYL